MQVIMGVEGLDYDGLCIHQDIDMPIGYKLPKLDIFDGEGNPHVYLRAYCNNLVDVERNYKLRMKLFIGSIKRSLDLVHSPRLAQMASLPRWGE